MLSTLHAAASDRVSADSRLSLRRSRFAGVRRRFGQPGYVGGWRFGWCPAGNGGRGEQFRLATITRHEVAARTSCRKLPRVLSTTPAQVTRRAANCPDPSTAAGLEHLHEPVEHMSTCRCRRAGSDRNRCSSVWCGFASVWFRSHSSHRHGTFRQSPACTWPRAGTTGPGIFRDGVR